MGGYPLIFKFYNVIGAIINQVKVVGCRNLIAVGLFVAKGEVEVYTHYFMIQASMGDD